jgi:hypothetical protein
MPDRIEAQRPGSSLGSQAETVARLVGQATRTTIRIAV